MAVSSSHQITDSVLHTAITQLREFVEIRSVSNPNSSDYSKDNLQEAANFSSSLLQELGFDIRQVTVDDSPPFVLAEKIVDAAKPTILFYAHFDVQPVSREKWETDPFILTELDERLYGRGASDDKGGIIAIITALGIHQREYGALPCNVKILFEGEEEYGSTHMARLLQQEGDRLKADALIILDGTNRDVNTGTLMNSTRGVISIQLKVETMGKPVHSGIGCLLPDPGQILSKLIVSLEDPTKIPGFMDGVELLTSEEKAILAQNSQTVESYARDQGLFEGVRLRGDPNISIYERITEQPSITILNARWGNKNGGNSIQESAECEIGIRPTAGQDPQKITEALCAYLQSQDAQGAKIVLEPTDASARAWKGDISDSFAQMYLTALAENFPETHVQPCGGALPLLHDFKVAFPNTRAIIPGVEDPKCSAHSHNESLHIGLWKRAMGSVLSFLRLFKEKSEA